MLERSGIPCRGLAATHWNAKVPIEDMNAARTSAYARISCPSGKGWPVGQ
jgi:hypothetical protein